MTNTTKTESAGNALHSMNPIKLHKILSKRGNNVIVVSDRKSSSYRLFTVQPEYGLKCSEYEGRRLREATNALSCSWSDKQYLYTLAFPL